MNDTVAKIKEIIAQGSLSGKSMDDNPRFEDLGMDSLDFIETVMAIEDHFSIEIPDGDFVTATRINDFISAVMALIEQTNKKAA
jgi:acyl carrier protein